MAKIIFLENEDLNKTAFLNWRTKEYDSIGNMIALAEGFISSAIELAKECINNNSDKKADILIFPILTNVNHGIELYLKSLIWTLNKLTGSKYKMEGSHNIQQMFQTARAKIKSYKDEEWLKHFDEQNYSLAEYINELFTLIATDKKKDNMDFSRYPISNNFENHFYVDSIDNVKIDLENFVERFKRILEVLDETTSYFFYEELKGEK
ncbi:MAG: hypothetical protein Q8S18_04050 [Bacteroidales bacterium]|nr:hypothetical protein [Bacteroidales bacterium]